MPLPQTLACSTARRLLPLRTGPVMKVSSPMIAAWLMRTEMPTDLAETIGNGTLHQIDEPEAAVEIGAPYVRAQGLRLGEGLRPLVIVHEDLSPRGGEKNHR